MVASLLLMGPGLILSGYVAVRRAGMAVLYRPISLPDQQVRHDISYIEGSTDEKHRLDLFLPQGTNWPVLIFVHGGGLTSGDKSLHVFVADVYGNIGRCFAAAGIGVAVINYRLQPHVTWRQQVEDVASATAWVYSHLRLYGADTGRLFIGGHSAGAHLSARVALDPKALGRVGLSPETLSGVIAVCGAAFDLCDNQTYRFCHRLRQYEQRFRCDDPTEAWKTEASPIRFAAAGAPPFLVMYPEGESKSLQRQSQLLHEALRRNDVPSELLVVPGEGHCRMVLALSRPDKIAVQAVRRFIENPCQPVAPVRGVADLTTA